MLYTLTNEIENFTGKFLTLVCEMSDLPALHLLIKSFIIDREAREIMHLVASVRLYVYALTAELFDLRP